MSSSTDLGKNITVDFSDGEDETAIVVWHGSTIIGQVVYPKRPPPPVVDDNGAATVAYLRAEIEALKMEWGRTCRELGTLRNEEAARRLNEADALDRFGDC